MATKQVFTATWEWYTMVRSQGELAEQSMDSWPDDWETLAGEYADDPELDLSVVSHVAERHEAIKPGDVMVSAGYGQDVKFLRRV